MYSFVRQYLSLSHTRCSFLNTVTCKVGCIRYKLVLCQCLSLTLIHPRRLLVLRRLSSLRSFSFWDQLSSPWLWLLSSPLSPLLWLLWLLSSLLSSRVTCGQGRVWDGDEANPAIRAIYLILGKVAPRHHGDFGQ